MLHRIDKEHDVKLADRQPFALAARKKFDSPGHVRIEPRDGFARRRDLGGIDVDSHDPGRACLR